jgi:hypothetical protein
VYLTALTDFGIDIQKILSNLDVIVFEEFVEIDKFLNDFGVEGCLQFRAPLGDLFC